MAKYADYDTPTSIEAEIDDAAEATATREPEVPSQFKGKSAAEVAESYQQLKALSDRQANELGSARQTLSNLTEQVLTSSPQESTATHSLTVDELYEDPQGAIDRAVDMRVSGKLEELDQATARLNRQAANMQLESKFPDYVEDAASPEMRNWIKDSGYRQRLASAADNGDTQAAEDLLGMYYDLKGTTNDRAKDERRASQLKDAALESGTSETHSPVEKFSRAKLELARIRSKQGDREAEAYMKENAVAIRRAYEEGRIVN
jgi:hypothetical protein